MSGEENAESNPFFEVVQDSIANRDSLQKQNEAEQRKSYEERQKILSQSKTNLAKDVRSAIKDIPHMKLNLEGSIEFESEAFAWMISDEKPHPLNGEEKGYVETSGRVFRIKTKGGAYVQPDHSSTHEGDITCVSYSPDGLTIASGSADKTIRIWNAQTAAPVRILSGHEEQVLSVSYSPDGTRIASGSDDNTIRIWNAQTGALVMILSGHERRVLSVSHSPDGTRIASASDDKTIRIWNAKSGDFVKTIAVGSQPRFLSHSPDGMMIATAVGNEVKILHAKTGKQIRALPSMGSVRSVSFSPDGTKIAFCSSYPGGFSHWNIRSGEMMTEEEFSNNQCSSICYTSDGKEVIIGAYAVTIIYNVKTETHHQSNFLGGPTKSVSSAFREASEVCNIINETNTHLEDVGFKLTTDNGLKFILSWNKRIE